MNRNLLAAAVFLSLVAIAFYWQLSKPDSGMPAGHMMGETTGADGSAIVSVKLPPELSGNAQLGKTIFDAKCATCHGENAAGQNGVAPPLIHKFYRPGHHGDAAFLNAAVNGVRAHHWTFGDMPPVEGITPAEVKLIVRYIRELQKTNGIF